MSDELTLNCWVIGTEFDNIFHVTVSPTRTVSQLRDLIWEKAISHSKAPSLLLFKVSVDVNDFDEILSKITSPSEVPSAQKLGPLSTLSEIFDEVPPVKHIHIIVQCPNLQFVRQRKVSTFDGLSELISYRHSYLEKFPTKAPSDLARPSEAKKFQSAPSGCNFHYDRPPSAASAVPVTLLHPVFNDFIDDCENHQPTRSDHAFAMELASAMSAFFDSELARQIAFVQVCSNHGASFVPSEIIGTRFKTDGDMRCSSFIYCLGEIKAEIGSKGAEPIFQGGCYYTAYLKHQPDIQALDSSLPCLGLYLVGPILGFFGLAFTKSTNIQVLNHPLRLDYHYTDGKQRRIAARYLGALRKAVERLKRYYESTIPKLRNPALRSNLDPRFPCYNHYTSLIDSSPHTVTYLCQPLSDKLIFFGESAGYDVCVKFVTRYSKEAHLHCASLGIAPQLRGFETLPGSWLMIVMDRVDEEYVGLDNKSAVHPHLRDSILTKLVALRQAGLVHGDVRDTNVMVRKDGKEGFMLLDFDWAGRIGEVCYPMNVNSGPDLWRPHDAYDEEKIIADHDIQMAQKLFEELCI